MWNPERLFPALAKHGMLQCAMWTDSAGVSRKFDCGFFQPDQLIMSDEVQDTDYMIEYETRDAVSPRVDDRIHVCGMEFKVRQPPMRKGNGFYSTVLLTKV